MKKLYKSEDNKVLCGVCGGLGEFLGIDPTIVRLIWVVLALAAGSGTSDLYSGSNHYAEQTIRLSRIIKSGTLLIIEKMILIF